MSSITRRRFLGQAAIAAAAMAGTACTRRETFAPLNPYTVNRGTWVNDVHSQLNPTRVAEVVRPHDLPQLQAVLKQAAEAESPIALCGGRHAGGGQQFLKDRVLVDCSQLTRVLNIDLQNGLLEMEAGAQWPAVLEALRAAQPDDEARWTIHQKQGGADQLSLGGAVSANVHGRCLNARPIVQDVESLTLLEPDGTLTRCSRDENADRFFHVIGGYGLFGVVYAVQLRLVRRQLLAKRVLMMSAEEAIPFLEARAAEGAVHGDFQFSVDEGEKGTFMRQGLLSYYEPAPPGSAVTPVDDEAYARMSAAVLIAAHTVKGLAQQMYQQAMLKTDGEVHAADDWQAGNYAPGYHEVVDRALSADASSEVLSEIYVPRDRLAEYLRRSGKVLWQHGADLIYGTVRLIRRDDETALAWAKQDYACVIFNLHTQLRRGSIRATADAFRGLMDLAIGMGGSYYLTYHRFARKDQVLACYPQLPAVLEAKRRYDPAGLLQSDWYNHYAALLKA